MILPHAITQTFADTTKNFDRIRRQEQFVSTLPLSPFKGQVVYYQNATMAEKGVVWTLRYRAGSTSTHKWEFVGGSALLKGPEGSLTISGKKEEKALTGGPELTTPLVGDYVISGMGEIVFQKAEATESLFVLRKNGVSTGNVLLIWGNDRAFSRIETSLNSRTVSLTGGDVLTLGCAQETVAGETTFLAGALGITPIRVG